MKKLDNFLTSEVQMRQRGLGLRQRIQEEGRGQGWIEQGGKQLDLLLAADTILDNNAYYTDKSVLSKSDDKK